MTQKLKLTVPANAEMIDSDPLNNLLFTIT